MHKFLLTILLFIFAITWCFSQNKPKKTEAPLTRILLIFDASNSMNGKYNATSRMDAAKKMCGHLIDSLQTLKNCELALRVYGNQKPFPPQDCNDTHLEVPFNKGNANPIKDKVNALIPKGTTPIARSLMAAIGDFPMDPALNIVVLITDGIEACDGDACEAAKQLLANGIVLKPFIIGIGLNDQEKEKLTCVGEVFDLNAPETIGSILSIIIHRTLNETTCQVNLLDYNDKATFSDINMTFTNNKTKAICYNFVHKMNVLNLPDTLRIRPGITYKLVVHTIPEIVKDSIRLEAGRHTVISVKVPLGALVLRSKPVETNLLNTNLVNCIIRPSNGSKILNVQSLNSTQNYLEGVYDIDIQTLPPVFRKNIDIATRGNTVIEVPLYGTLKISGPYSVCGTIFKMEHEEMEQVLTLSKASQDQQLRLQPGSYKIVYRSEKSRKASDTNVLNFSIRSNETTGIRLQ